MLVAEANCCSSSARPCDRLLASPCDREEEEEEEGGGEGEGGGGCRGYRGEMLLEISELSNKEKKP